MTSDGTLLSVAEVLRLADEAEIIPTVFSSAGAMLARVGRVGSPRKPSRSR